MVMPDAPQETVKTIKDRGRRLRGFMLLTVLRTRATRVELSGARALVVAPHPDDETLGCGGMIAKRVRAGHQVSVAFLTAGGASLTCAGVDPGEVAAARRRHACDAAAKLGLDEGSLHWLGLQDGGVPGAGAAGFADAAERLQQVIETTRPEIVYAPHPCDGWDDHRAAAEMAAEAAGSQAGACVVQHYGVWIWRNLRFSHFRRLLKQPVCKLDIGEALSAKRAAIECYLAETAPGTRLPYCGDLPDGFLKNFTRPQEFFFGDPSNPRTRSPGEAAT